MDKLNKRDLIYIEQSININIVYLEDFQPLDYVNQIEYLQNLLTKIKELQKG